MYRQLQSNSAPPPELPKSIDNSAPSPDQAKPPTPAVSPPKDLDLTILKAIMIIVTIIGGIIWYLRHSKQAQQQLATLPPIERIDR
jgi:hypothetical protein